MRKFVVNIIDTLNDHVILERFAEKSSVVIEYAGADSPFNSIMASELKFNMDNETADDGRYLDLFTGEERRYLVEVKEVFNSGGLQSSAVVWRGYMLPDIYSEPYKNVRFFVEFTATDCLATLRNKPFVFYKTRGVMYMIARCLYETGLVQQIYFAPGVENAFMSWSDIQIFEENFYSEKENTGEIERDNCYEVLEKLLKSVGATLFQANGRWYIVGYNRKHLVTDKFVIYDWFGNRIGETTVVKNVWPGVFNSGLNVRMASPFQTVQLNVNYERDKDDLFPEDFFVNKEVTSEEYNQFDYISIAENESPLNKWIKTGNVRRVTRTEDEGVYLQETEENIGNGHVVHLPGTQPKLWKKPPYYVSLYKIPNTAINFSSDYITLKNEFVKYVSPQVDGKSLNFEFDIELRITSRVVKNKYDDDFYRQAFRMDIMLGDAILFSTRSESGVYKSDQIKIKWEDQVNGPDYFWYRLPDMTVPYQRLSRFATPARLEGEIKLNEVLTGGFGKLNVRLYAPRNGDNSYTNDFEHAQDVTITKFDIKVKTWDNEKKKISRGITYTTKYEIDLPFSDGKNDLYDNLFKLREREDYRNGFNEEIIATAFTHEDELYHYIRFPGNIAGEILDNFRSRYSRVKIYQNNRVMYLHEFFGNISVDSGLFLGPDTIIFSKARINEFPYHRDIILGFTKITYPSFMIIPIVDEYSRDKYIAWKRAGYDEQVRYLDAYGKMIHECQYKPVSRLDGTLKRLISPLDLISFNWMGDKNYFPARLSLNLSEGNSDVFLIEATHQNITDYVNVD